MIGFMGVKDDGKTLITPSGRELFKVPSIIARWIQRIQHYIARKTWY